jgi:dipeptidyl aminopeptidase/acylaminoacyl peptidase
MNSKLPPLIPREILFGNPKYARARISPDGRYLAYLAPYEGVLNIWIKNLETGKEEVITKDKKRGIQYYLWSYDSENIIYIQDKEGDENWRIYSINIKTKEISDLTPFEGVQAKFISYNYKFPDKMLIALNRDNPALHDVYLLDLETKKLELIEKNPGNASSWITNNNLEIAGYTVIHPEGNYEIMLKRNGKYESFMEAEPEDQLWFLGFSPDNRNIYILSSVGANALRLIMVNIKTGEQKVIAEDEQFDIHEIHADKDGNIIAVSFYRQRLEWEVIDKKFEKDYEILKKWGEGDFHVISQNLKEDKWIVAYFSDIKPISYYMYDTNTKKLKHIFTTIPEIEKYTLSKTIPISFKARDGMKIYGYLTLPPGVEHRNLPMVVLVHGGPWARDVWMYDPTVQWLANRGYAVLQVNFRGSSGYGKKYLNAGNREWGGKMITDIIDGKNWVVEKGYVNPEKIAIMGGSYGGYAVLAALAFHPNEFICGVDIVGPSNLITFLKSIPPYWKTLLGILNKRLGKLPEDEEFLKSISPLYYVDNIKVPLLIIHGANDPRVKKSESDQIVKKLREKGIECIYIVYPDEGHGLVRPENRLDAFGRIEEFLSKHLGGRKEPFKKIEGTSAVIE